MRLDAGSGCGGVLGLGVVAIQEDRKIKELLKPLTRPEEKVLFG